MTRSDTRMPPHAHEVTQVQLETFEALNRVHDRDGRSTVRTVAAELGLGHSATYRRLLSLRAIGLAAWVSGADGTLRPTCRIVAVLD